MALHCTRPPGPPHHRPHCPHYLCRTPKPPPIPATAPRAPPHGPMVRPKRRASRCCWLQQRSMRLRQTVGVRLASVQWLGAWWMPPQTLRQGGHVWRAQRPERLVGGRRYTGRGKVAGSWAAGRQGVGRRGPRSAAVGTFPVSCRRHRPRHQWCCRRWQRWRMEAVEQLPTRQLPEACLPGWNPSSLTASSA